VWLKGVHATQFEPPDFWHVRKMREDTLHGKEHVKMESVTLTTLVPGEHGTVETMSGLPEMTRRRLLEMGVTRGTRLRFVRRAPLGDPIEIHLKGYRLILRTTEARGIYVYREKDV
jgi:ferrous iron transport protein A